MCHSTEPRRHQEPRNYLITRPEPIRVRGGGGGILGCGVAGDSERRLVPTSAHVFVYIWNGDFLSRGGQVHPGQIQNLARFYATALDFKEITQVLARAPSETKNRIREIRTIGILVIHGNSKDPWLPWESWGFQKVMMDAPRGKKDQRMKSNRGLKGHR